MKIETKPALLRYFIFALFFTTPLLTTVSCHKLPIKPTDQDIAVTFQPALSFGNNETVYLDTIMPDDNGPESTYVNLPQGMNFNGDSILSVYFYAPALGFDPSQNFSGNTLLLFDSLQSIPVGSKIISAVLYLYGVDSLAFIHTIGTSGRPVYYFGDVVYPAADTAGLPRIAVQPLASNWADNSVCWNLQPAEATADSYAISPATVRWHNNVTVDITDMVKSWVANPSINFGCKLSYTSPQFSSLPVPAVQIYEPLHLQGPALQMQFYSSYAANALVRPKLVVTYSN